MAMDKYVLSRVMNGNYPISPHVRRKNKSQKKSKKSQIKKSNQKKSQIEKSKKSQNPEFWADSHPELRIWLFFDFFWFFSRFFTFFGFWRPLQKKIKIRVKKKSNPGNSGFDFLWLFLDSRFDFFLTFFWLLFWLFFDFFLLFFDFSIWFFFVWLFDLIFFWLFFSPTALAMGSLHNMVSVCSGRAGAVPGKKRVPGRFREPFREPVPMGSEVWIE